MRPKTWAVLEYLVSRPGILVTKSELLDAVWPGQAVTESVLSKSIGELRVALGDSFKNPKLIETVQRRGFRFLEVLPESPDAASLPASTNLADTRVTKLVVGREDELQRLTAALATAHHRRRQSIFVSGEAGIGKTTLLDAFLDDIASSSEKRPVWVAQGACLEQHGVREAYLPVLAALERLARQYDSDRMIGLLRRVAPTWLAQLPLFIGDDDEAALRQALQDINPERMLREFATFVETLTVDTTLVLILEDLHWSDSSTIDLLWLLAQRSDPAKLLMIGTFRPADAIARDHPLLRVTRTLRVRRQCIELPLSRLPEEEVVHYLRQRFPNSDLSPALARPIHRHTNGNPLFLIGVVDHLLAKGSIRETAFGWSLTDSPDAIALGIPDDVRLLIENDLKDSSAADVALLQAASVAGDDFTPPLLAAALELDLTEVEDRCESLARARRFLRVTGHAEWPDGSIARRYSFVHELYRQAVYTQIAEGLCMRLHRRIGRTLETAYGARHLEIAPELALHFERGRDDDRALRYLSSAAMRARLRFANREALGYIELALGIVSRLSDDQTRLRQELALRLTQGAILVDLRGFGSEEVRENLEHATRLATAAGTPAQQFEIAYARWYLHAMRAERDEAILSATRLRLLAGWLGDQERAIALSVAVRTAAYDMQLVEARRLMHDLSSLDVIKKRALPTLGPDPILVAATHAALAAWFLGDCDEARARVYEALAQARQLGHFFTLAGVLTHSALLEVLNRNGAAAKELATEAIAICEEHGFPYWRVIAAMYCGGALIALGQTAAAIAMIKTALAAITAMHFHLSSGFGHASLANAFLIEGNFEDGLAAAEAGLAICESSLDRTFAPEIWRLKGELLMGSRPREAEVCFQRSLDLAQRIQAKSLEARAAISMARLWRARGDLAAARALLDRTCKSWVMQRSNPDLIDARALHEQLTAEAQLAAP